MIINCYTFFMPIFWMTGVTLFATLAVPFIVFVQMCQHHDKPEYRHKLHDTYRLFAIFIGLPLIVFNYMWGMLQLCTYLLDLCAQ